MLGTPAHLLVPLGGAAKLQLVTSWQGTPQQELVALTWFHPEQPSQSMQVSSLRERQGITMVGLSPLGQELWRARIQHDGALQSSGLPPFDDPRLMQQVLANLQLASWPIAALQPQLADAKLIETPNGRTLLDAEGTPLWRLTRDGQHSQIEHLALGYRLELHLITRETLSTVTDPKEQP